MRVHHKNLTSIVGYCDEDPYMVIIYEYMAGQSLKEYLSGKMVLHVWQHSFLKNV